MKKTLRPFQITGAKFLVDHPHALLADEMGLGKTVTALAAVEQLGLKRILVVCPASVRTNWAQEIAECGIKSAFNIISYNGAVSGLIEPKKGFWDLGILDEVHFCKTPESQRTQAIFGNGTGLARRCNRVWGLTGTPVLNRPRELLPILQTLHSEGIKPYQSSANFYQRFCGAYFDGRGINTKGASHIDDLRRRLEGFMLRRIKAEVMPELPPRIISHPPMELTAQELSPVFDLEAEMGNREAYLSPTHEDYAQLGDMARLLKATGIAKISRVVSFVKDLLETVDKVVIFAHHRDVISGLMTQLSAFHPVQYHGGLNDIRKKAAVDAFVSVGERENEKQNHRVFIGQIQAAGTGINGLQKVCSNLVFAELSWVPGEMAQAIDRCHRIGQTSDAVNVYMPHVPGTLESAMLQVQLGKQVVIDRLMGAPSVWRGREWVTGEEDLLEGLI